MPIHSNTSFRKSCSVTPRADSSEVLRAGSSSAGPRAGGADPRGPRGRPRRRRNRRAPRPAAGRAVRRERRLRVPPRIRRGLRFADNRYGTVPDRYMKTLWSFILGSLRHSGAGSLTKSYFRSVCRDFRNQQPFCSFFKQFPTSKQNGAI